MVLPVEFSLALFSFTTVFWRFSLTYKYTMFAVVEFENSTTSTGKGADVAVVSTNWFTPRKKEVFWPPYKDNNQYRRSLRSHEKLNTETWKLYKVEKIFYETASYEKSLKKLKLVEVTSDIQTDEDEIPKKRSRNCPKRLSFDTDNSDSSNELISLPRPPIIRKISQSSTVTSRGSFEKETIVNNQNIASPGCATPSSSHTISLYESLLTHVVQIKEQNKQIISLINQLQQAPSGNQVLPCALPSDFPITLPAQNENDVELLEDYLKNTKNINALILYFTGKGVKDPTSATNRIIKQLLLDSVAVNYSFYGKRANKKAFARSPMKDVVVGSVRACTNCNEKEVEDIIKVWLKHAPQRLKIMKR